MLSRNTVVRLIEALTSQKDGNAVASAINNGAAIAAQSAQAIAAAIIAAHTSTTTDFAALQVNDLVLHIPAVAGNSIFYKVVTAGTLPAAAVVGDLYLVVRAASLPAASNISL